LQNAALEREALVKERVRDAPAECVSQQAGTILSTLMLRARTMPPDVVMPVVRWRSIKTQRGLCGLLETPVAV
jgi:hypothetical protein